MPQQIRRSQFIFTYGPGAILEGRAGPRVILTPDIGLFHEGSSIAPGSYEIYDQRMSQGLLNVARIFRLPSNAELTIPEDRPVYRTNPFPYWQLCINSSSHKGNFYVLYQGSRCPVCGDASRGRRQAIRFIKACPAGHMDEVDWYVLAHGDGASCQHTKWFRWYDGGGSLSNIRIECPVCGSKRISLGEAYRKDWTCMGRFPERELPGTAPYRPECNMKAKIIQRQASNLRIPELLTLFSIPPRHTRLHGLLQISSIQDAIIASQPASKEQLEQVLGRLAKAGRISQATTSEILQLPWEEIKNAIDDVCSPVQGSYRDLIIQEFNAMIDGSLKGIPPARGPRPRSPVQIEIDPNHVKKFTGSNGTVIRVAPVSKLRTVTVQVGYRREVDTSVIAKTVDVSFLDTLDRQQKWYPGVEFFGEGIFIVLDENDGLVAGLKGRASNSWINAYQNQSAYSEVRYVFRDPLNKDELHPGFVWWHTLSHLLIRAISAESGYSSASIRERIYLEDVSRFRGGILLYATQPGSEGTLGGLIALIPHFQRILQIAIQNAQICSGDPLCKQHEFHDGQYNGAACYSCLLLSETSCEHRNMWLDRNVLLEALP
jgi:hypothetical protein